MDPQDYRAKVRQLSEDLSWLEEHCRKQPDLATHTAHLRMAAALTRNVVGPSVELQPAKPLFLAVVGGAGAGKSSVVNFLAGAVVAEANPQAGYTRHPTACLPAALGVQWPSYLGFLGPLTRLTESKPANLDEDVYQVKRIPAPLNGVDPLGDFVIWDCPDMTTWASSGYVSRLMEVVGLADIVIYVASDERYNDEMPTQFLHHVIRAGKAVIVCLTKMKESDAEALTEHFRKEVLGKLPKIPGAERSTIPCVTIPHLPPEVRTDPMGKGAKYRVRLLNEILVLCPSPEVARARTVQNALRYLQTAGEGLLDVARKDLSEIETWRSFVKAGRQDFEQRYTREFLAGESFSRFDRTREQVLEMLELPGPGKFLSAALALLRLPYRYARDFILKLVARPDIPNLSEYNVCTAAMSAWTDSLQAEALRRTGTHPVWRQISQGFDAGLKTQCLDRFHQIFRTFELKETNELDEAAKSVPDRLANNHVLLTSLRLAVVLIDLIALGGTLWLTWFPTLYQLLLIPVAVSLSRQVVELVVYYVIEAGRSRLRKQRESLVSEHLSGPIAAWLSDWPTSGGSSLEKLQMILRRVPDTITALSGMITLPDAVAKAPVLHTNPSAE